MARLLPVYLDAVVSIEVETGNSDKAPIATGFLFGQKMNQQDSSGKDLYRLFLVTNRHVFENPLTHIYLEKVFLRFNMTESQSSKYYEVNLLDKDKKPTWIKHELDAVDIAVLPINAQLLRAEGIRFFFFMEDAHAYLMKDRGTHGIATGDGVYVLGFPLGIRGSSQNFVIARRGIIARVDEEVLKEHFFFVDVSAYPGNSGGPVIIDAEIVSVGGTKTVDQSRLVGVVSQGVAYQEVAISQQTGRPRIIFEEQTGLVKVVPIDSVLEAIEKYLQEMEAPPPEKSAEAPAPVVDPLSKKVY
jgi:S1-C subfamily serine protease